MPDGGSEQTIVLEFPPHPEYLVLARTVMTSVANTLALDYETCEDLRLAVDELCAAMIDDVEPDGLVRLDLTTLEGVLVVNGRLSTRSAAAAPFELDPLAMEILNTVTDGVEVLAESSDRTFRFEKLVTR